MIFNIDKVKGKTALVTGGAKRIGQAICDALIEAEVNLVVHYNHSGQEAEHIVTKAKERGFDACSIQADLSSPGDAEDLLPRVLEKTPTVDYLIQNAAVFPQSSIRSLSRSSLLETLEINTIAPLVIAQQFAAYHKESRGAIVHMLDSRTTQYDIKHVGYQLSKNMLYTLTKMMALEFGPQLRVNAIAPGLILPPPGKDQSYIKEKYTMNILNRAGTLSEIASSVLFLLCNEFITGEVLFVDGGQQVKGLQYE